MGDKCSPGATTGDFLDPAAYARFDALEPNNPGEPMNVDEQKAARRILAKLYARGDYDVAGMIEQYLEQRAKGAAPPIPALLLE
jgi:hypothetical protein